MNQGETEAQRQKLNELSGKIIGACIEIHRELGPGLLESAYEECLAYELTKAGLRFERQRALPVRYKEVQLDCGYRLDFVVEGALILARVESSGEPIEDVARSLALVLRKDAPSRKRAAG